LPWPVQGRGPGRGKEKKGTILSISFSLH